MCGILGVISPDVKHPGEFYHFLNNLLTESEIRGRDASGFAALSNGDFVTDKLDVRGKEFVKLNREWRRLRDSKSLSLIGHTRAATNGSPGDNENNHPFHGPRYSMAHNGGIWSFRDIAKSNGWNLHSECDSEVILHALEEKEYMRDGIVNAYNNLDATAMMAVCTLDRQTGSVHLFRCSSAPLSIMRFPRWNAVVFASTLRIIADAAAGVLGKWGEVHRYGELEFGKEAPKYSHIEIKQDGRVECTDVEDMLKRDYSHAYTRYYGGWDSSDYTVFSGGTSKYERARSSTSSSAEKGDAALENTQIIFRCIECSRPIDDDTNRGALHEAGADFMCDKCWKGETDLNLAHSREVAEDLRAIHGRSVVSSPPRDSSYIQNVEEFIDQINPIFPLELRTGIGRGLFSEMRDALEHEREPKQDHALDDWEIQPYMSYDQMDLDEKLNVWSNMTLKRILEMGDGEYLAYFQLISDAVEIV